MRLSSPRPLATLLLSLVLSPGLMLLVPPAAQAEPITEPSIESNDDALIDDETGFETDLAPTGDPTLEGMDIPADAQSIDQLAAAPLAAFRDSPLKTNGVTAGYIDTEANKAFAATRTANPAVLIDYDITSGARKTVQLPEGTGSWDMAKSGDMLAVGTTAGAKANTTHVSIYNTKTKKFTKSIPLPGSRIVMSVVEDTFEAEDGNGRYFWVGTYHPNGAKLFRVDIGAGTDRKPIARDRTPKNSSGNSLWSKSAYVRSLSADASGVTVGLGTEVTDVWRISQKGKAPKRWNTEITSEVQDASFAYSLASHAPQTDEEPAHTLIGTEQPAKLIDIDSEAGTLKRTISLDGRHTVDRIAVDGETETAWFTTRPTGALYSLDLSDVASKRLASIFHGGEGRPFRSSPASRVHDSRF